MPHAEALKRQNVAFTALLVSLLDHDPTVLRTGTISFWARLIFQGLAAIANSASWPKHATSISAEPLPQAPLSKLGINIPFTSYTTDPIASLSRIPPRRPLNTETIHSVRPTGRPRPWAGLIAHQACFMLITGHAKPLKDEGTWPFL